ncbi:receptor-like protein kinase FERONIA [Punica granatum]|uniref:Protein kinase domain-containing protein n=2 Tax=Punica granatum TaxID=22663 RepID=A0A218XWY4_PUNGR|nr:receptor-like protein kinase FERONIA [Punica granatum]OWM89454.1 hypothetical protein CDL15_Pgr024202 [Punica granatum]PKI62468.1 hypothetical protein CRG98_017092 [Punica granatum]
MIRRCPQQKAFLSGAICLILLAHLAVLIHADMQPSYVPTEKIKLDCDPSSESSPSDDRETNLDLSRKVLKAPSVNLGSGVSPPAHACIFHTQITHQFPITPGPKFIRLHFYPTSYQGLSISDAIFSISIEHYTLLRTTPASYSADRFSGGYIVREYIIDVDGEMLNLTFTPSNISSDSYAFVNMIEVLSMPQNLYIRDELQFPPFTISRNSSQTDDHFKVLETAYRINVGGPSLPPDGDTGMLRQWVADDDYVTSPKLYSTTFQSTVEVNYSKAVPAYTAPGEVYLSARIPNLEYDVTREEIITWMFWVDSGFHYHIRLHFCEIRETGEASERVFGVHINSTGRSAEGHVDVINLTGQPVGAPIYKDYMVNFSSPDYTTLEGLQISIISSSVASGICSQGILNGLEIFKMADSSGNLAGQYPFGAASSDNPRRDHTRLMLVLMVAMVYVPSLWFVCLLFWEVVQRYWPFWSRGGKRISECKNQSLEHAQRFSLEMIKLATNNFSEDLLIGVGGFGKVYKGSLDDGITTVAIKRASAGSGGGLQEFQTEISLLSKLRHRHLVSLLGYCMEDKEMILIYNFMERGTLRENLYRTSKGPKNPPLSWKQRLEICIGAARGLHYLHTGIKPPVIHRDVKSSNILLDHNWEAKLSDFGLSKTGPNTMMCNSSKHVNTAVRGTFGYVDPEYLRRMALTEKSDVYSYGVVLFEVLCARPAIISVGGDEDDQITSLAEWVLELHRQGNLEDAIDPHLHGEIDPSSLLTFIDIAKKCLEEKAKDRPSSGDVLSSLELAWQQQCITDSKRIQGMEEGISAGKPEILIDHQPSPGPRNSDQDLGVEFSEIICPLAR